VPNEHRSSPPEKVFQPYTLSEALLFHSIEHVQDLIDRAGEKACFADRFRELLSRRTIIHWRRMHEFSETVSALVPA
jgi:hypothetical protein